MATVKQMLEAMTVRDNDFEAARKMLTPLELEKLVKHSERGFKILVGIRLDAGIDGEPGRCYPDAVCGSVRLSKRDAMNLVRNGLSQTLVAKGARFSCYVTEWRGVRSLWISQ